MAQLSDLEVYSKYAYTAMTEIVDQKIEKFNAQSRGAIVLTPSSYQGDYSDVIKYKKIDGLVRRRNAYSDNVADLSRKKLEHLVDTMVKVAAGTPPVDVPPSQWKWIQRSPEEAGVVLGQQLAPDMFKDMLNTAVLGAKSAMEQVSEIVFDGTAGAISPTQLLNGSRKFGDNAEAIRVWLVHSNVLHDYYAGNLANTERLFSYNSVNVISDAFGRVFIVSDIPALVEADGVGAGIDKYSSLGLVSGAIVVGQNNDFDDNWQFSNGKENIQRSYQAEWSYQLGVKGFAWNKANGGASPQDVAIGVAASWDQISTSHKDLAGVVVQTR